MFSFLLFILIAPASGGGLIYGTDNGYDVGGNESVCTLSNLPVRMYGEPDNNTNTVTITRTRAPTTSPPRGSGLIQPSPTSPPREVGSVQHVNADNSEGPFRRTNETGLWEIEDGRQSGSPEAERLDSLLANISALDTEDERLEAEKAAGELLLDLNNLHSVSESDQPRTEGLNTVFRVDDFNEEVDVELLSECFNGTWVDVVALDLEPDSQMFRELTYKFRVNVRIDVQHLAPKLIQMTENGLPFSTGIFFRFVMCDAVNRGYCNPVVENPAEKDALNVSYVSSTSIPTLTGTHVPSEKMIFGPWALPETNQHLDNVSSSQISVDDLVVGFQLPPNAPAGIYRFVFHATLVLFELSRTDTVTKLDTASIGEVPILTVKDDPKILEVSHGIEILIYVLIAVYGLVVVAMLAMLFRYWDHPAIKLAQGPFLAVLLGAALVGGTFCFTFIPEKDVFCLMRGPLVMFPYTLLGTVLVARLWRVYVTLSGAMRLGRDGSPRNSSSDKSVSARISQLLHVRGWDVPGHMVAVLTSLAKMRLSFWRKVVKSQRTQSQFRQTATGPESVQLAVLLVLPQAILQTVGDIIYTPELELVLSDDMKTGRYYCSREWEWVATTGYFYVALMYVLAVVMAWQSRHLPSVFNEKDAIFHAATMSSFLVFTNIVIAEVNDDEKTSPDTAVFLRVITFLGMALLMMFQVVYPKIVRARKGEKVVVGNLLRAYAGEAEPLQTEAPVFLSGAPIVLGKDDALPENVESHVHQLQSLLRGIGDKCASGRPLSKGEWGQMRRYTARLKTELDRVKLEWDEEGGGSGEEEGADEKGSHTAASSSKVSHYIDEEIFAPQNESKMTSITISKADSSE